MIGTLHVRGSRLMLAAVALIAFAVYARFILSRAINVPFHDDILDVLGFIVRYADAASVVERLQLLFEQYNDHRTAASRAVYLLALWSSGAVDFRTLALLGNLFVPSLVVLYAAACSRGTRLAAFALAALVLCQPRARDFLLWPMSLLAFQGVIVYGFACLLALEKLSHLRFMLAALLGAAAMCSLSSGQLVWLAGAVQLAYAARRRVPDASLFLAIWLLISLLALLLFHAGFRNPNPVGKLFAFASATPLHHLQYFLCLLGSAFSFNNLRAAMAIGLLAAALLPLLTPMALRAGQTTLVFFSWYLLFGIAVVALGRAPYSSLDYALEPRYSVASLNLLLCLVLLALQTLAPGRAVWGAMFVLAACFSLASYRQFTPLVDAVMAERARAYDAGDYSCYGSPLEETNRIVAEAVSRGFYVPPARPLAAPERR